MEGYSKYLLLIIILSNISCFAQKIKNPSNIDIVMKSDTVYNRGDSLPYTGNYKEYYIGPTSVEGKYVNGLKDGEFYYYSSADYIKYDSIINYKFGKKNGIARTYTYGDYLKTLKNYINDTLDGYCYTWWQFGQLDLIDFYIKGKLIKETECPIDFHFETISIALKGVKDGKLRRSLVKSNASIDFIVVGHYYPEDSDTSCIYINLTKYKIISFSYRFCGRGDFEQCWEGKSPINVSSLNISTNAIDRLDILELYDILIENHCGVQYNIPLEEFRIYN